jgi:hypothetical protein
VLPPRLRWLNVDKPPVLAELTAAGPVLVHFFDFAQLNSLRALPYVLAWGERYRDAGLATLGIHSPRFGFSAEGPVLGPALERLGVAHPVADDSRYAAWHDYGCKGWPSLFLWGQGGALRWAHFGEGEYEATERAIAAELAALDPGFDPPPPLDPLRPTDATGAMVVPPSEEVLPGGSLTEPWTGGADGALELEYAAGGAHASIDGEGELRVTLDGGGPRPLAIEAPGLYDLTLHPRHERHALRLEAAAGLAIYSVSFSPALP